MLAIKSILVSTSSKNEELLKDIASYVASW